MTRRFAFFLLGFVLLTFCGCRTAPSPAAEPGDASFCFAPASDSKASPSDSMTPEALGDVTILPQPILPLAKPIYPPAAAGRHHYPVTIGVLLRIDRYGAVTKVADSPTIISTPTPWRAYFRAAIDAAVRRWRFVPAMRQYHSGGDSQVIEMEQVPWETDVAFTFTPSGGVWTAPASKRRGER